MKKFLIVVFLIGCAANIYAQDLPTFKVKAQEIKGSNSKQETAMRKALQIFEEIMNDTQFKTDILALERVTDPNAEVADDDYDKKYKVAADDENSKFTTEQIIRRLYSGKEFFDSENKDNEADIFWHTQKRNRCIAFFFSCNIRGSTLEAASEPPEESDRIIYLNSWFIKEIVNEEQKFYNLVEHISHEWTHKFGFLDTGSEINKGKFILFPYVWGRVVEKHAKKICSSTPSKCKPV